jgi:hypothetical protein
MEVKLLRRLLFSIIAVVALMVMTVPAMADEYDSINTVATVGGGGAAPYVIAVTMTPDDNFPEDGIDVLPEPAKPYNGYFESLAAEQDGWKMVKFYVIANHDTLQHTAINLVTVDVYYPDGDGYGPRKFELDAIKSGDTSWTAEQTYDNASYYPAVPSTAAPLLAMVPSWEVRELQYTDLVDVDADGILDPVDTIYPYDVTVGPFLSEWGSRIVYNTGWNAANTGTAIQGNQALMLELTGYIWFHQPALTYIVDAKASTGIQSEALSMGFDYMSLVSLYLDFEAVNYGTIDPTQERSWAPGDTDLSTADRTTIWNNGNANAQVAVSSTRMVLNWDGEGPTSAVADYNNAAKTISNFDATLFYKAPDGTNEQVGYITFSADQEPITIENTGLTGTPIQQMGAEGPVLLQSCRPAKIEFSVEPNPGIVNGNYGGCVTIELADYSGGQAEVNDIP